MWLNSIVLGAVLWLTFALRRSKHKSFGPQPVAMLIQNHYERLYIYLRYKTRWNVMSLNSIMNNTRYIPSYFYTYNIETQGANHSHDIHDRKISWEQTLREQSKQTAHCEITYLSWLIGIPMLKLRQPRDRPLPGKGGPYTETGALVFFAPNLVPCHWHADVYVFVVVFLKSCAIIFYQFIEVYTKLAGFYF